MQRSLVLNHLGCPCETSFATRFVGGTMQPVIKGFRFEAWHILPCIEGKGFYLSSDTYRVTFSATGSALARDGHIEALGILEETIGRWLRESFANRLVVSECDQAAMAYLADNPSQLRQCVLPIPDGPAELAEYLLVRVAEPLLRARGLLVDRVFLKRAHMDPQEASLSLSVVRSYLAEQSNGDGGMSDLEDHVQLEVIDELPAYKTLRTKNKARLALQRAGGFSKAKH